MKGCIAKLESQLAKLKKKDIKQLFRKTFIFNDVLEEN